MPRRHTFRRGGSAVRAARRRSQAAQVRCEPLEPRLLLSGDAPCIDTIFADNRGLIILTPTDALNAATINQAAFSVTSAGADSQFGTADDVGHAFTLELAGEGGAREIRIMADVDAGTRYRVTVNGDQIRGLNGEALDAEFNGSDMPTGDGVAGGQLEFFTRRAFDPTARIFTVLGDIDVRLFQQDTPISVANFLSYADSGRYDNTYFHRLVSGFVLQGGGFLADTPTVQPPRDPQILNEPGISNLRGTLAFAKLGGQPNSATNQFFFNLGNNSQNLDNQNGGFAVFAEVVDDAGLAIMDALAGLTRIDFSSIGGAFGEVPVLDADAVDGPTDIAADNLAVISRISLRLDIVAEPPGTIDGDRFSFSNGNATVTIIDLSGVGIPTNIAEIVKVRFDGSRVSSVTLQDGLPRGVAISIEGASSVSKIIDARRTPEDLGVIVSSVFVGHVKIKGDITGVNINGLRIAGMVVEEDLDGDGDGDDLTSVFVADGRMQTLEVAGATGGDIVVPGGVSTLKILGDIEDIDIMVGSEGLDPVAMRVYFGRVADVDFRTQTRVNTLYAVEWVDKDSVPDQLRAPSIEKIAIKGDRRAGIAGDFAIDAMLSGMPDLERSLGSLSVNGFMYSSRFEVVGDAGTITLGDVSNASINIAGDMKALKAKAVSAFDVVVVGEASRLTVCEWIGGGVLADSIVNFIVTGDRRRGMDGDLTVDIAMSSVGQFSIHRMTVAGDVYNGQWVTDREVRTVAIKGEVRDMDITFRGDLDRWVSGQVLNTDLNPTGLARVIDVPQWMGGSIEAGQIDMLRTKGDRRLGLDGDFSAEVTAQRMGTMFVRGDLMDSNIRLQQNPFDPRISLHELNVIGVMQNSVLRSRDHMGVIMTSGMVDSAIFSAIAEATPFGFPPISQAQIFGQIDRLLVRKSPTGDGSFTNSFVASAAIRQISILHVDTLNAGQAFGIAAGTIESLTFNDGEEDHSMRFPGGGAPQAMNDFQLRLNFAIPTV